MKKLKISNKYRTIIAIAVGIIIALGLVWVLTDREESKEPNFRACQNGMCITGEAVQQSEGCVINERMERICGPFILFINKDIKVESPTQ